MMGMSSKPVGRIAGKRGIAEVGFVVMWSSGFIGARIGTQAASTPTLMAWRFLFAAGLLMAVVLLFRRSRPSLGEVVLQGVVGFLAQGVYLSGTVGAVEFGVSAGSASLVAALQPLLAAALAGPVLGERVRSWQWVGLVVGLVGVALVVGGDVRIGGDAPLWAYALPFFWMAGLVAATLLERKANLRADRDTPLDVALAIQCAVSAVLFTGLAFFWGGLEPSGGMRFWAAVLWFVVFSTFGGYGFYWLNLKLSGVARVSSLIYLTPPTTMVWAYLMFGEGIGPLAVVGLVICFGSVLLASRGS
jgi:drug/metabolite transporter (DMT)-like permease